MIAAIPRTRVKGNFVRPEADVLENMRLAFFPDVTPPAEEPEPEPEAIQQRLPQLADEEEEEDEENGAGE